MSITKKAISLGMSAALIASLAATIAAPAAFASTTLTTSAGVIPDGGTSTTAASYTICENTAGAWSAGGTITIAIAPASPGTGSVTFTSASGGTVAPSLTAPGALGASLGTPATASQVVINISGDDGVNVLCFTVGNLYITASANASTGAIVATATGSAGTPTGSFTVSTVTATGTLQAAITSTSSQSAQVNVTSTCGFQITNGQTGSTDVNAGTANFSDTSDPRNVLTGTGTGTGIQTVVFGAGTATHGIGATVTQTVSNCNPTGLASPGTVAAGLTETTKFATIVNPGEQNQAAGQVTVTETQPGTIPANTVLTFTISSPSSGVTFSQSANASSTNIGLTGNLCTLNFGLLSCSVTVGSSVSTSAASVTISGIILDVASTVPAGTPVNITVTSSPAVPVVVTSNTIATVARILVGVASQPTIYINYNAQATGQITLTESAAGQFQASGATDAFGICITTGESFTFAPFAIVTTGDLKLLNPSNSGAVTTQVATLYNVGSMSCASWTIYSASTVASTITIVGANASGPLTGVGPTLSVPGSLTPGPTQMDVMIGTQTQVADGPASGANVTLVTNAVRAYKSGIVVTALSQPFVAPGTSGAAGNVTVAETLNGQLKAGETFTCKVLPPVGANAAQQVYLVTAPSNLQPVVSTNTSSGLIAHLVGTTNTSFTVMVDQQAYAPALGTVTVSNINYTVVAGATTGPVQIECTNSTGMTTASGIVVDYEFGFASAHHFTPSTAATQQGYLVEVTSTCPFVNTGGGAGDYIVGGFDTGAGTALPESGGEQVLFSGFTPFDPYLSSVTQTVPNCVSVTGGVAFDQFVSNALVGTVAPVFVSEVSAKGVTQTGPFSISTLVSKKGQYITIKITTSPAMAGAHIGIWVSKKVNGVWTKFSPHTGRIANGQGVVYYYYKAGSVAWLSFQAHYPGDATHSAALGNAVQARWIS